MNAKKVKKIRQEAREVIRQAGFSTVDPDMVKSIVKITKKRLQNEHR